MKVVIPKGATSRILTVFIQDSSSSTGAGLGSLTNASGIVGGFVREGSTGVSLAVDEDVTTEGTYQAPSAQGKVRIGTPANMRTGTYELHFHNNLWATGAETVTITLGGATDMADLPIEVQLSDPVRGLGAPTALPNAAAEAAGGLYTRGTGAGQINQSANGQIDVNMERLVNVAQSAADLKDFADDGYDPSTNKVQGLVLADAVTLVNGLASNVITAASIATGAIDADAIADNAIDAGAIASGAITNAKFAAGAIDAAAIANNAIDAATFASDVDAEILSYLVDDATRIDASALNTASVTTIPGILADTDNIQTRLPAALVGGRMSSTEAIVSGTSDSGTTTTMVDAARTEADTDYWKGDLILFTSGTISGQVRLITAFDATTDTITFTPAVTQTVDTQTYEILPAGASPVADVNVVQWNGSTDPVDGMGIIYADPTGQMTPFAIIVANDFVVSGSVAVVGAVTLEALTVNTDFTVTGGIHAASLSLDSLTVSTITSLAGEVALASVSITGYLDVDAPVFFDSLQITGAVIAGDADNIINLGAGVATFFNLDSGLTFAGSVAGSVVREIGLPDGAPSLAQLAPDVVHGGGTASLEISGGAVIFDTLDVGVLTTLDGNVALTTFSASTVDFTTLQVASDFAIGGNLGIAGEIQASALGISGMSSMGGIEFSDTVSFLVSLFAEEIQANEVNISAGIVALTHLQLDQLSVSTGVSGDSTVALDILAINEVSAGGTDNDINLGVAERTRIQTAFFGDCVTIDTTNGTAGTTFPTGSKQQPSSVLADALTIATARGLTKYLIRRGTIAPAATYTAWYFEGCGKSVSVVNMSSRSYVTCLFENLQVGGIGDCTGVNFRDCLFSSATVNLGATIIDSIILSLSLGTGTYTLKECSGLSTGAINFGAAVGSTTVDADGWKGTMTLTNLGQSGTDTLVMSGVGTLDISDSSNIGGTIDLHGQWEIVGTYNVLNRPTITGDWDWPVVPAPSGMALEATSQTIVGHVDTLEAGVASTLAAIAAIPSAPTAAAIADAVWDEEDGIDGLTLREFVRLHGSTHAGKSTVVDNGDGTQTETYRNFGDTKTRLTAIVNRTTGARTSITTDLT